MSKKFNTFNEAEAMFVDFGKYETVFNILNKHVSNRTISFNLTFYLGVILTGYEGFFNIHNYNNKTRNAFKAFVEEKGIEIINKVLKEQSQEIRNVHVLLRIFFILYNSECKFFT